MLCCLVLCSVVLCSDGQYFSVQCSGQCRSVTGGRGEAAARDLLTATDMELFIVASQTLSNVIPAHGT